MAINISTISNLIADFRAITAKDSVSPDSLGYLLQLIVSLIEEQAEAASSSSDPSGGLSPGETVDPQVLADLQSAISSLQATVGSLRTDVKNLQDEYLHSSSLNSGMPILEFSGFISSEINVLPNSSLASGSVMFSSINNAFVYMVAGIPMQFFSSWDGVHNYGSPSANGVIPSTANLYLDKNHGIFYRWNGTSLVAVSEYDDISLTSKLDTLASQLKALEAQVATYHSVYDGPDDGDDTERDQVRFLMYEIDDDHDSELQFVDELPECDYYFVFWYPKHKRFYAWWVKESLVEEEAGLTPAVDVGIACNWPSYSDYYAEVSTTPRTDVYFVTEDEEGEDMFYYYSAQHEDLRPAGRNKIDNAEPLTIDKVYVKTDDDGKSYIDLSEALSMLTTEEVKAILANS